MENQKLKVKNQNDRAKVKNSIRQLTDEIFLPGKYGGRELEGGGIPDSPSPFDLEICSCLIHQAQAAQ